MSDNKGDGYLVPEIWGVSFRTVRLSTSERYSTHKGIGARKSKGYPTSKSTRKADAYAGKRGARTPKNGRTPE